MTRRLDGQQVVICRAKADATPLIERLEGYGAAVVSVPLVEPTPPADNGEAMQAALSELSDYQWVVTTSANGSRAVLSTLGLLPGGVEALSAVKIACVGTATAQVFRDHGIAVELQASVSSGVGLVSQFSQANSRDRSRVLAPLATLASKVVVEGLASKGYGVDRVDAYDTVAAAIDAERRQKIGESTAILFTSSSTVERFVEAVGSEGVPAIAVSIGPQTTKTMQRLGIEPTKTARQFTQDGVIDALLGAVPTIEE